MDLNELNYDQNSIGIDIDKVSAYYGNRRTVVHAFLSAKTSTPELFKHSDLNVFEVIELQLGYPIPIKVRKNLF